MTAQARFDAEEQALLESYFRAGKQIDVHAMREFAHLFAGASSKDVPKFRDKLIPMYVGLVEKYGEAQASLAADFYDELRSLQAKRKYFSADPEVVATAEALRANVVSALGSMFKPGRDNGPDVVAKRLEGSMLRQIRNAGRTTLINASRLDQQKTGKGPKFIRLLQGTTNCNFCVMLASRGAVYSTRETAGEFDQWHDKCDCKIVPIYDDKLPDGYDLNAIKELYYLQQYGPTKSSQK